MINAVYSDDYSPKHHLKSKLRYLKQYKSKCQLVICKRHIKPEYSFVGDNKTRHIEDQELNGLKNIIRSKYNPRDNLGNASHDHVIHAFDNQLAGWMFANRFVHNHESKVLNRHRYHVELSKVRNLKLSELKCSNYDLNGLISEMPITSSVQYDYLVNGPAKYNRYLSIHLGNNLNYWHSSEVFSMLKERVDERLPSNPIIVSQNGLILDGLHRAAIAAYNDQETIEGIVIDEY